MYYFKFKRFFYEEQIFKNNKKFSKTQIQTVIITQKKYFLK